MPASGFLISQWLFLKALALVYLIAFASFGVQAKGLVGTSGILPLKTFVEAVREAYGSRAFLRVPMVFYLHAGDRMVTAVAVLGSLAALFLFLGVWPRLLLVILYILYLSIVHGGQDFFSFQWDILLLETGFLALFLHPSSNLPVYLFWWLLFRLMVLSGAVKLLSGDPTWRALTAMHYHFETQPLPTIFGWFAHQLPAWAHRLSTVATFVVELGLSFLLVFPRVFRLASAAGMALLQVVIGVTGNYTYFNVLTLALILLAVDDGVWSRVLPEPFFRAITGGVATSGFSWPLALPVPGLALPAGAIQAILSGAMVFYGLGGLLFMAARLVPQVLSRPAVRAVARLHPFFIVNHYGLFAVMTTVRNEIVVEGSRDGDVWEPYEFRHKPGDVRRAPQWVQPHQPRLDWQMWFLPFDVAEERPWFLNFVRRLLEGSPEVLRLLARNPFPDAPPRYVRARMYEYHFTTSAERRATGAWWKRELKGIYLPPASLQ